MFNVGIVSLQQVDEPESWVHPCYFTTTWKDAYTHKIGPINGSNLWPKSPCPTTLLPPNSRKPIGRPKKNRRKDQVEVQDIQESQVKLSRKGGTVTCAHCNIKGHNKRSCKKRRTEATDGEGAGAGEGGGPVGNEEGLGDL